LSKREVLLGFLLCGGFVLNRTQSHAAEESVDLGNKVTMELVRVEAGTFRQGSPPSEAGRAADETQREVVLTRPFYIGKYPVTYRQFARFVEETRFRTEAETGTSGGYGWDGTKLAQRREFNWRNPGFPQTDQHPVVLVTYLDAEAFANWLSRKSGRKFRMPTEAQWEYACRAGTTTTFPTGDSSQDAEAMVWHKGNSPTGTQAVGGKAANAWGIHDMLGLTWEWCEDFYGPYSPGRAVDPVATTPGPGERPRRVLRGGSWLKDLASCRAATRYRNDPRSRNADNGFRLVTFDATPVSTAPIGAPAAVEPKLEREDDAPASSNERLRPAPGPAPRPDAPVLARRHSFNPITLFVFVLMVVGLVKIVRALLAGAKRPSGASDSLRGSFQPATSHLSSELTTRVVDDGFWIQSNELPAGTLLTCRYTTDEGTRETSVHFEPGRDGHFVFTGSRPRALSVVVVPRGPAAGMMQSDPLTWQTRPRDDDDNEEKFRGFPSAY
jgi:formylglycine-generating enzyme required for sulfatase activity